MEIFGLARRQAIMQMGHCPVPRAVRSQDLRDGRKAAVDAVFSTVTYAVETGVICK